MVGRWRPPRAAWGEEQLQLQRQRREGGAAAAQGGGSGGPAGGWQSAHLEGGVGVPPVLRLEVHAAHAQLGVQLLRGCKRKHGGGVRGWQGVGEGGRRGGRQRRWRGSAAKSPHRTGAAAHRQTARRCRGSRRRERSSRTPRLLR